MSGVLVVLASAKGSPGVTTAAVALAATAPGGSRGAVLEVDPSGGDLGPAFGLAAEPGLVSLASAARRDHRPGLVWGHTQELPGGLPVVAAPAGAEQAASAADVLLASPALRTLHHIAPRSPAGDEMPGQVFDDVAGEGAVRSDEPGSRRGDRGRVGEPSEGPEGEGVLWVDTGRLPPHLGRGASVTRLLGQADVVLLVVRNDSAGIAHAAARLASVSSAVGEGPADSAGSVVRLLLVEADGYPAAEVAQALQTPVVGTLPWDPRAAAVLAGRPTRRIRNLGRLPLLRAAAVIGAQFTASGSAVSSAVGSVSDRGLETGVWGDAPTAAVMGDEVAR